MKYAPRKVYIKESGSYVELSYTDFCRRKQADQSYMDKLFIPVQGCLLEVVREQYTDFYQDKERWRYLQKLDTNHKLLSLEGFTDSEGNVIDFVIDEAVDVAETVVHLKYDILKHPNVKLTADGGKQPYFHGEPTQAVATFVFGGDIPKDAVTLNPVSTSYELLSDEDLEEIFNL
ncbi:hypothetical protein D7V86_25260 [bacterium D16-51]|nr:hypothetical protein D7V96_26360 [bacterium D16-59]RKI53244.1 hypothetical protein D7V86_25260 [bacterium D16-51]